MLIQHKQIGNKGMFFVGQDGAILAEMVYSLSSPNKMIIEHTEVDESLSGKGVGKQLVETAVLYARNHDIKIVALCPFAKGVLDIVPAWQDVLFR
jgi:predicted GNAT family acetyltransferase